MISACLIEIAISVLIVAVFLGLIGMTVCLSLKYPHLYHDCHMHIDLFEFRKNLNNGKNDRNSVLGSSASIREDRESREENKKEEQKKSN